MSWAAGIVRLPVEQEQWRNDYYGTRSTKRKPILTIDSTKLLGQTLVQPIGSRRFVLLRGASTR